MDVKSYEIIKTLEVMRGLSSAVVRSGCKYVRTYVRDTSYDRGSLDVRLRCRSNATIAQWLVHLFRKQKVASSNLAGGFEIKILCLQRYMHPWPSGLRRSTQVRFSSEAWVRIPPDALRRNKFLLRQRQKNLYVRMHGTTPVRFELTRAEPIRFLI